MRVCRDSYAGIMNRRPAKHDRRSIRLKGYDYSLPGAYFVTICTQNKRCLFGGVVEGQMRMNDCGRAVHEEWWRTETIRPGIRLDAWVVMPNHVHGIVMITRPPGGTPAAPTRSESVGAHSCAPLRKPRSMASIIAQFKASAARRVNEMLQSPAAPMWQRNYYQHIIRSDRELIRIRKYVATNSLHWPFDPENPSAITPDGDEFPWEL